MNKCRHAKARPKSYVRSVMGSLDDPLSWRCRGKSWVALVAPQGQRPCVAMMAGASGGGAGGLWSAGSQVAPTILRRSGRLQLPSAPRPSLATNSHVPPHRAHPPWHRLDRGAEED